MGRWLLWLLFKVFCGICPVDRFCYDIWRCGKSDVIFPYFVSKNRVSHANGSYSFIWVNGMSVLNDWSIPSLAFITCNSMFVVTWIEIALNFWQVKYYQMMTVIIILTWCTVIVINKSMLINLILYLKYRNF